MQERALRGLDWIERAVALLVAAAALYVLPTAATEAGALWRDEVNGVSAVVVRDLAARLVNPWYLAISFESVGLGFAEARRP